MDLKMILPTRKRIKHHNTKNSDGGVITDMPIKKTKQISDFSDMGDISGFASGVNGNGDVGGNGGGVAMGESNDSGIIVDVPLKKKKTKQLSDFSDMGKISGFASGVSNNGDVAGNPAPSVDGGGDVAMGEAVNDDATKTYSYSCAMLPITKEIAVIMKYWTQNNIPADSLWIDEDTGMEGYENDPHVTIKYGLHTDDPDDIDDITKGYGAVTIQFGNISKFDDNPNFDVIKVDIITSKKLVSLNKLLSDNIDNTEMFPEYKPHATLAFVKKGECDHIIGDDYFTELTDNINQIYFTARDGSEHYIDI